MSVDGGSEGVGETRGHGDAGTRREFLCIVVKLFYLGLPWRLVKEL
ncbi:MAG: hypothetical protein F6K41_14705 [Symploca sp. SIO3E6]|nr:hypothetical protein [Caldora sp. SIO3E6]